MTSATTHGRKREYVRISLGGEWMPLAYADAAERIWIQDPCGAWIPADVWGRDLAGGARLTRRQEVRIIVATKRS